MREFSQANAPKGGIAVDYHDMKVSVSDGKYQFEMAPSGPSFSHRKTIFIFGADDEKTCTEWMNTIRPLVWILSCFHVHVYYTYVCARLYFYNT